jgi:serine/threonine protein kinase
MGVVYKARDTRLDRFVALKTIGGHDGRTTEALQRFEREARAISSLSHPHICALFDVGSADGVEYLVMELLEGQTLASRIASGPMPIDAVLKTGIEIAQALAAAHARGIVHRDLKPGNVMLTASGVKLLDFGLAKSVADVTPGHVSDASTAAVPTALTERGTVLGTAAYMAPEQIQGEAAAARSDVFALGVVLYEMVTGRRAFAGSTSVAIAGAILHHDPPSAMSVRSDVPPALDRLVRACLVKNPAARWQTAHDAALELIGISEDVRRPPAASPIPGRRQSWLPWALAAMAVFAAGALWLWPDHAGAPQAAPLEIQLVRPPGTTFYLWVEVQTFALSPDGGRLAFIARDQSGTNRIWIRSLTALDAKPVPGTEQARSLFWSPDGRTLAWFASDALKKIDPSSGIAIQLCSVEPDVGFVGSWSSTGRILFASVESESIFSVSDAGGPVTAAVEIDHERNEVGLKFPWFLPDGRRFLYTLRLEDGTNRLMLGAEGAPSKVIGVIDSNAQYVSSSSQLVFVVDGTLVSQPFDLAEGKLSGSPTPIVASVDFFLSTGLATFATSPDGTLVYQHEHNRHHLSWVDRDGKESKVVGTPGDYYGLRIASAGRLAMLTRALPATGTYDIWSLDLERGPETRLTSNDRTTEIAPLLLPDQRTLIFSGTLGGPPQLLRKNLETGVDVELLPRSKRFRTGNDVTPDGSLLVYGEQSKTGEQLWTWPLAGTSPPALVRTSQSSAGDAFLARRALLHVHRNGGGTVGGLSGADHRRDHPDRFSGRRFPSALEPGRQRDSVPLGRFARGLRSCAPFADTPTWQTRNAFSHYRQGLGRFRHPA